MHLEILPMNDPKCKRFHRKYEDFSLCVNIGEKDYVLAEHPNERYTIFYYGIYGSGLFGKVFGKENPIVLDSKKNEVVDVQHYINDKVLFEATEDFYIIGFNTLDKNIKWKYSLLNQETKKVSSEHSKSYLVCLNGKPLINNHEFKRYDYSPLSKNKEYGCEIKEKDVVVIFSQINS